MKLELSRQIFEKYSNIIFHDNQSRGSRVVPCGQMDTHDELNSLCNIRGTIRNSLTQPFIDISITTDTRVTCFDSYRVIFRPSENTDPITKEVKCTVGTPMLTK